MVTFTSHYEELQNSSGLICALKKYKAFHSALACQINQGNILAWPHGQKAKGLPFPSLEKDRKRELHVFKQDESLSISTNNKYLMNKRQN